MLDLDNPAHHEDSYCDDGIKEPYCPVDVLRVECTGKHDGWYEHPKHESDLNGADRPKDEFAVVLFDPAVKPAEVKERIHY